MVESILFANDGLENEDQYKTVYNVVISLLLTSHIHIYSLLELFSPNYRNHAFQSSIKATFLL